MILIILVVLYDPLHLWLKQTAPPVYPPQLAPNEIGSLLAKLFSYFSVPLGVILGGIFGTDSRGSAVATRSNVVLLYTLSNAWGAIMVAATMISIMTPANIIHAVGTGRRSSRRLR